MKTMKKRCLALLLSAVMLLSVVLPVSVPVLSVTAQPYIALNGEKITSLVIQEDEKVLLEAVSAADGTAGYGWQIRDVENSDRWLDIAGLYGKTVPVSYALIGSMLDSNGTAFLRCCVTAEGEKQYTEPVELTVSFHVPEKYGYAASAAVPATGRYTLRAARAEHTTCSIVINYLFDNNTIAFEPYGASVAYGSDFQASVTSPTVMGYAPFRRVGENYVDASVVELDFTNIQENVTINVIYEPALVEFSVHHHLQNLLDDEYSVHYDLITTNKALTGTVVGDGLALTEEQLPGFKSLAYEKLTVAADGSTVIEIRYDRNYYLVDFDMAGGYGTEPVYTRYGATVGANTPIRHGYVFDGWELVSYNGNPPTAEQAAQNTLDGDGTITVPAANLRYRARWITQQTSYTMVFWKENANDDGYSYWGYLDGNDGLYALSGSYVDGMDYISRVDGIDDEQHFTFDSSKTDRHVLVEGDGSTVVNVYYARNRYKLTFTAPGLCKVPVGHVHDDACYRNICGLEHTHSASCVPQMTCPIPAHSAHTEDCIVCGRVMHTAHTDACLICGKMAHTHGDANCACQLAEHTHAKACWSDVGNSTSRPGGAPTAPEDGYIHYRNRKYYIYIKGRWYNYSGRGASSGDVVEPSCGHTQEHAHGTGCACDLEVHAHVASCYADELHVHTDACYRDILHAHDEDCYGYSCGYADEHTHGDSCKLLLCGITENHTHGYSCNRASEENTVKTVFRKYQQSLEDLWPILDENGVKYDGGERWDPSTYFGYVLVYISKMPPADITLSLDEASYTPYVMNYWLQILPGDSYAKEYGNLQYALKDTIKAQYNYVTKAEDFFDIPGFVQYASDPTFSGEQIDINSGDMTVDFYYNRITDHWLEFYNNGTVVEDKRVYGIMYGAPLKNYNFVPEYPDNLEPNAYAFAGWYSSPGCFDGTEVDWDTLTMSEGDLLLYAKWVPITHTVRVFKDASMMEQIGSDQEVAHKGFANAPTDAVSNGNYVFQGWFYAEQEDGETVEKAFVFNGIPVTKDLDVYAKWGSHVAVDYRINYVLLNTGETIAESTYGSTLAGNNKTFYAKVGEELFAGYQTGFYPMTSSHTVTMSVDGNHEFTFYYVYVDSMPYSVSYVNAATGEKLCPDRTVMDNTLSVATETFQRFPGMMPDAYQKRLVLAATGNDANGDGIFDENAITFYYNQDDEHAYYRVVHYIRNITGDTYREYRSEETVGEIGQTYTVEALNLTGFNFNGALTRVNGVVTPVDGTTVSHVLDADGVLIELYYDRSVIDYTVRYIDSRTRQDIVPPDTGSGVFGEQVLEYAYDLTALGYDLVSDNLKVLTISVNDTLNVIEFLYQERVISLKYQIVGPAGCGVLSQYSENVMAITGKANGSAPIVSEGFLFDGWYTDAACTVPATNVDASGQIVPQKAAGSVWTEQVFYAKFIATKAPLTITTTGVTDADQAFLFRVSGKEGTETAGVALTVSVIGNGSVVVDELPTGEYTVMELSGWSWRYEADAAQKAVAVAYGKSNAVTYTYTRENGQWLDGNAVAENVF